MQARQDHLDTRDLLAGMDIDRHPPAVVGDGDGGVTMEDDLDALGMARDGLVHAVVHDLLDQVVGAGRVGEHARPLADRIEA